MPAACAASAASFGEQGCLSFVCVVPLWITCAALTPVVHCDRKHFTKAIYTKRCGPTLTLSRCMFAHQLWGTCVSPSNPAHWLYTGIRRCTVRTHQSKSFLLQRRYTAGGKQAVLTPTRAISFYSSRVHSEGSRRVILRHRLGQLAALSATPSGRHVSIQSLRIKRCLLQGLCTYGICPQMGHGSPTAHTTPSACATWDAYGDAYGDAPGSRHEVSALHWSASPAALAQCS